MDYTLSIELFVPVCLVQDACQQGAWLEKEQGMKDPEVVKEIFESEDKNKDMSMC